jgi:hypothetical protein
MFGKNKVYFAGTYPACFESKKKYDEWKDACRVSNSSPIAWVCSDCTPDFQHKMIGEGRCENSHISFRMFGKGPDRGIEGYLKNKK